MKKTTQQTEKIQKILAHRGVASRRQVEQMLLEGRIRVNGRVANLGDRALPSDQFYVNGRVVKFAAQTGLPRVILYHKPVGELCTRDDPHGRPTVFANLPPLARGRWITIGRLDFNTSGLLLLTDAGDLAHQLMHPAFEIERQYAVRVFGEVTPEMCRRLCAGVMLEDGEAKFLSLKAMEGKGQNQWFSVTLRRGRNREVRRLWESQGVQVSRLIRIAFAGIKLPRQLRPGASESLGPADIQRLQQLTLTRD